MADRMHYNGQDKWKSKATDVINDLATQAGGNVDDVMVDGVSVVDANKVAQIDLTPYAETSDLATVATTGDYDDLSNKPTIPAAQVQSDWLEADTSAKSYILNKPTIPSTASDVGAIPTTEKGANSGVAELDSNGKVPSSQLPSYVDDVVEVADYTSLPSTGETGKIYITLDDNKTYRWSGSAYVEISPSLALGETSSTAYRGDRGKTAYDHATETKAGQTASGLYKIGVTAQGHVASATAVQKSDITALGIPSENTTYTLGTSGNYVTLTPSSGSAQSVTAPYATNAGKVNNHTVGMDIPTPTSGDETKYLGGDGTFQEVSPKREASGSVVSFSDGSTYPLSKCVVQIEPVQAGSGEPSPTNIRPISGWTEANVVRCGVNLFDKTQIVDGYINDNNGEFVPSDYYKATDYIPIKGGMDIYIKSEQTSGAWGAFYDANKDFVAAINMYYDDAPEWQKIKTAPTNAYFLRLTIARTTTGNVDTFSINYPSTDTAYEPYQGNTYTISFSSAGTVYGGTLNVLTGELVVDRHYIDASSWGDNFAYASETTDTVTFFANMPEAVTRTNEYISNRFSINIPAGVAGRAVLVGGGQMYMVFNKSELSELSNVGVQQWFFDNPTHFVYYIATPQTYTLTATQISTLLGNNTIYADTGDVDVEYVKEPFNDFATKEYVDAGLSTKQDTLTASTNITIDASNNISASDSKVAQNSPATVANNDFRILLSGSADNTDKTEGTYKHQDLTYNPSKHNFKVGTGATSAAECISFGGNASGYYSFAHQSTASGTYSFASGYSNTASGDFSTARGGGCQATANYSTAQGQGNTASGTHAFAIGQENTASGTHSVAEGYANTVQGNFSSAIGQGLAALSKDQHVTGTWNTGDMTGNATTRGTYVEIVGNGSDSQHRSNARTLDWSGNETLAGKLTVGANPTNAMDVATKDYVDGLIAALRQQLGL